MHKISLVLVFFFSILSFSQSEDLIDVTWQCTNIVINGDTIDAPNNDEVMSVILEMIQDNDPGTEDFMSNVCNSFSSSDSIVTYNDPESTFTISSLTQTLSMCGYPENDFFESNYFNLFYSSTNVPLSYQVISINNINMLTITTSSGDTANYEELILSTEENYLNEISIYPNPATETITINSNNITIDQVEIYSMTGRIIKVVKEPNSNIDISNMSEGIYILKIYSVENSIVKSFIKN